MYRSRQLSFLLLALCLPAFVSAQDDEPSLGEMAREARKMKASESSSSSRQKVIDNDNFAAVLDEAEAARITGKPVFSIDPSGNAFRMTSPDGTCSLSFDAKATVLISSSFVSTDLPQDELPKLEGHALIHDDVMEITVRNGTPWELRELVIGITVLEKQVEAEVDIAGTKMVSDPSWTGKSPDSTAIYHLRGSAAPNSTATFTAVLGDSNIFSGDLDWHWALVSARGLPPSSSPSSLSATEPPSAVYPPTSETVNVQPSASATATLSGTAPSAVGPVR
jgi:hypothetical protein